MKFLFSRSILLSSLLCLPLLVVAQTPPAMPSSTALHIQTKVGSFKILGAGERLAEGTVVMTFTGTVLVSGLDGTIAASGKVQREINHEKRGKQVYFGTGKLVIRGKFKGLQWFGRNLNASIDGFGIVRLYGEFDRNLDTGMYWYGNSKKPEAWGTGGRQITTTPYAQPAPAKPRVRDVGKGGGS